MTTKLPTSIRSTMKEQKICSLTIKNGAKLNLLQVGSDLLVYPVYIVRCNRRELIKTTEKLEAIKCFQFHANESLSLLNELFQI